MCDNKNLSITPNYKGKSVFMHKKTKLTTRLSSYDTLEYNDSVDYFVKIA